MKSLPRFPDSASDAPELERDDGRSWSGLPRTDDVDMVGQNLNGTYVVESVLGEGGMGRVYQARHARIASKKLAIKVLRPEFARNADVIARFRREAETAAGIAHPNVIGVYDVDVTLDGHFYIVCEHLSGIDLAERLTQKQRLEVPEAIHVILQVCSGLEAAVARGVVHRDLKPHNVFLLADESGQVPDHPLVKVLDFGLSRVMDAPGTQLTQTGIIMGTPAYMAPEQAQGTGVDHRTDVYGVGALLFATLTGRPPYEAETLQAIVLAVLTDEPPRPRSLNPGIPENLELVIQRAMARKPEDRYQSMTALREALEPFSTDDPGFAVPSTKSARRDLLQADARTVSLARPRLLVFCVAAIALLVVGLASAVPSIELATGKLRFTRVEIALLLLAIVGTLLTPFLLLFRRVRRTVWSNHTRVLELLDTVRGALLWALVSYAIASAGVRFLEDVVSRFGVLPFVGQGPGAGWAGWNLLFVIVALVMTAVTTVRYRLLRRGGSVGWLSPALFAGGVLVSAAVLYLGFVWQSGALRAKPELATPAPTAPKPPSAVSGPALPAARVPSAAALARPFEAGARAPNEELALATSKGESGLLPLSERYPHDPAVLKALFRAFASRATGLVDAMTIAKRLFEVAPDETRDADVRFLVKKATATPGQTSTLAFALLAEHMASAGPDLLYELVLADSKSADRAEELLAADAGVRGRATPALLIANELRTAPTCAARLPLLERAAVSGDERSAAVLMPLGSGSKRGCGKKKRQPCPAPCPDEAERYRETAAEIVARVNAVRRPP